MTATDEPGASGRDEADPGARIERLLDALTREERVALLSGEDVECYSEDPELAAALAVGYVRGLQSRGVAATVKHFAGNESETERTTIDSAIDERTLREVYPGANGRVRYAEGPFTGYRHHDRSGVRPLFAFGHGLSYARFELEGLAVERSEDGAVATVAVANVGDRAGSTVVQLYVGAVEPSVARPARELEAFEKVRLAPGERRGLRFALGARAFARFDVAEGRWRVDPGTYRIEAGFSVADLRASAEVRLEARSLAP